MKWPWYVFVIGTIIMWGAYVPTLHQGQTAFPEKPGALRAFLFVGLAYFIVSIVVLIYLLATGAEKMIFSSPGVGFSTVAGALGAFGALGIVFALGAYGEGGAAIVPPLVFAGAPIVSTIVAIAWHPPQQKIDVRFFLGIAIAASGAWMALRYKPTQGHKPAEPSATVTSSITD